jgi:hypothetical protein
LVDGASLRAHHPFFLITPHTSSASVIDSRVDFRDSDWVRFLLVALVVLGVSTDAAFAFLFRKKGDIVQIARSFNDGGKYKWSGTGTPEAIVFKDETILSAGTEGTYCSGFTFTVVMKAAEARGVLKGKTVEQVKLFQKQWYGATPDSAEVQAGFAMEKLGIGKSVSLKDAKAGDFIQFWRVRKSGHSAVFLDWIVEKKEVVGFRYRSTQQSTDGIGDKTEYFEDAEGKDGGVVRARTYIARLNSR